MLVTSFVESKISLYVETQLQTKHKNNQYRIVQKIEWNSEKRKEQQNRKDCQIN